MIDFNSICGQSCASFYSLLGTFITSIIVIIGWVVTNRYANTRQNQTEQLTELLTKKEELLRELDKLDVAAREYYAGSEDKRKSAMLEIEAKSNRIDQIILGIEKSFSEKQLYNKFTILYEAITDGSFGSENINAEVLAEKYKRILLAMDQFYSEVETTFFNLKSNKRF